jgi:hypothetical protein
MGCKRNSSVEDLTLRAEILGSGWTDLRMCNISINNLFVKIIVKNNSNFPKSFWIMSCTWQEGSFRTDDANINFCMAACPKNVPEKIYLNHNDSIVFSSIMQVNDSAYKQNSFKIGLVMLDKRYLEEFIMHDPQSNAKYLENQKTFWSNSLSLKSIPVGYKIK